MGRKRFIITLELISAHRSVKQRLRSSEVSGKLHGTIFSRPLFFQASHFSPPCSGCSRA
jgi:hypothetical protein